MKSTNSLLPKERNLLGLCFIGLTIFNGLLAISYLINASATSKLANREVTFVQLKDGSTARVREREADYRKPETIKNFIRKWLLLNFNKDGTLPNSDKQDPGIATEENGKVPTTVWMSSMMMEPEFGQEWLNIIADNTPGQYFDGVYSSAVNIRLIEEPIRVAEGVWEITAIAEIIMLEGGVQKSKPYNRVFTVKATEVQPKPMFENPTPLEKTVYNITSAGLEITQIVPYNP